MSESTVRESYRETRNFDGCVLNEADLRELETLFEKNQAPQEEDRSDFNVEVDLPRRSIEADTINDLLQRNLPERFSGLRMHFVDFDADKHISIYFGLRVYLSVRGSDQQWVLGQYETFSRFLLERRRWYGIVFSTIFSLKGFILVGGSASLYSVAVSIAADVIGPNPKNPRIEPHLAGVLADMPLFLLVALIVYVTFMETRPTIHIGNSNQSPSIDGQTLLWTRILAVLGVVAIIVAVLK